MAIVMEYQSGSSTIIVRDDDIEDIEKQEQLLHHAWSVEVNADYCRYLEERKKAMEESKIQQGSVT